MRFLNLLILIGFVLFLNACSSVQGMGYGGVWGSRPFSTEQAVGYYNKKAVQCVPYAREASGVEIYGDAHTWWNQAQKKGYQSGVTPKTGAVLVLKKSSKLSRGHVAVVKRVVNAREIEVTHSNWGDDGRSRKIIYQAMRVQDLSKNNDWSVLRFWNPEIKGYGLPYPAYGFIYG